MKLKTLVHLLLILPLGLAAQSQISGTVVSEEDGTPLLGATILVVGTSNGTITDFDGQFILDNVDAGATLAVSYIGYQSAEVLVGDRTTVDIVLSPDFQQLGEVVVTGYTSDRKVDLTGAVSVVELGPVEGQTLSAGNSMQALQGRVPGLLIEKSGDPTGASSQVLIRGATTLGNNDPLYIIDGVPTVRQEVFASINPSAIRSVQVLKDASASSIYGARAGNGVIIVTTENSIRESDKGKINVSLNTNISLLSEKKQRYDVLNAEQRGEVLWQAAVNDGVDPNASFNGIYSYDWNGDFSNPELNSVTVQPYVDGDPNVPSGNTDWQDETYETGYVFNNEVSLWGGSDNSFTMLNLGYLNNTGILKYTDFERFSARLNSNYKLFDNKLKIGINMQLSTSDETLASRDVGQEYTTQLAVRLAPTIPLFDANGNYGGPGPSYSDRNNPVLMQFLNRWDNTARTNIFGNIYGEYAIIDGLTFRTSVGLDFNDIQIKDIEPTVDNGIVQRSNNRLIETNDKFSSLVFTNTLNYVKELGKHRLGILLGVESVQNDLRSITATADGFPVETEEFFVLSAATGAVTTAGIATDSRLLSQFGKINYAYGTRYLASFVLRRDGSSRFGSGNRYGIFPAMTVGWRLSEEDFLRDNQTISNLKFRAGYGEVGNQNIGDLASFGLFETRYGTNLAQFTNDFLEIYANIGTAYDIAGNNSGQLPSGFVQTQQGNDDLKWETTKEINLGLDFGFFDGSLSGSFDYYQRETSDILVTPPTAATLGEGQSQSLNGATIETNGWELFLNFSKTTEAGLLYSITTNFSSFSDEITQMPESVRAAFPGTPEKSIIGQSQFALFGYKADGLFQSQEEADASGQVGAREGGIKFIDLNNDGQINGDDRDFIGNTLPDLEYGVRIDLGFKNWDFSVFGSGVAGRKGIDAFFQYNNFVTSRENNGVNVLNAWTPTNTDTDVPAASLQFNDTRLSDYMLRNNSYFKLRNIQLGYSMPKHVISKWAGMSRLRFYVQGENLFWITADEYEGADPERTDLSRIPVPTSWSFGLNVNF